MTSKLRRAKLEALLEAPWALMPATLSRIVDAAREAASGELLDGTKIVALEGTHSGATQVGGVSVIPVYGVVEHHSDWMMEYFGGCSIDGLREALQAKLADPSVSAIVLDVDSPGGTVAGMTEFAAELRALRGGAKPVVTVFNSLGASAAYWMGAQTDEVVVTPSGQVGSVGVYAVHQDMSRMLDEMGITTTIVSAGKYKTEGNQFQPLTDEARDDLQSRVDASYPQFLADLAAGRRVSADQVEANFGGGRVLVAKKALAAGMVDRVETLAQTVARLNKASGRRRVMSAEDPTPEIEADAEPVDDGQPPFTERIAAFAAEATQIVEAVQHRARSRAAAQRPAFSTSTESALRASRDAIDALLTGEPEGSAVAEAGSGEPTVTPEPVQSQPATPIPVRFRSREDWLRHLEAATAH